jgi:hypothetical protein
MPVLISRRDCSLQHLKHRIARKRSGRRGDRNRAGGRACGNRRGALDDSGGIHAVAAG